MKKLTTQPYAVEPPRSIDLTLSENPLGCSSVVTDVLQGCNHTPSAYPTANGNHLKQALAGFLSCSETNIFVANGSENIILNIPRILAQPNDTAVIPQLSFPLFRIYCQLAGLRVQLSSMDPQFGICLESCASMAQQSPSPSLLFLCNPNNPTGMLLERSAILNLLDRIPKNTVVIIDEANIDFGGESVLDQALQRRNVIVLRTFSKGFGLAGFRIGCAIGDPLLIQLLTAATQPFPISSLSEQVAIAALSDLDFVEKSKWMMTQEREIMKRALADFGCMVIDSQANNIFAQLPSSIDPTKFFVDLANSDVSVVRGSKFIGYDDSFFRVSPRNSTINQQFLRIMQSILKK